MTDLDNRPNSKRTSGPDRKPGFAWLTIAIVSFLIVLHAWGQSPPPAATPSTTGPATGAAEIPNRDKAAKLLGQGNYKEAYEAFSKLALDKADDPEQVGGDLTNAVSCLQRLGRSDETDGLREGVIAAHGGNWRLLWTAAQSYTNDEHYGYIVAGKFYRGQHRGGGKVVDCFERDRVRALQLMQQAMKEIERQRAARPKEPDGGGIGSFFFSFAEMLLRSPWGQDAWRLQYATDLSTLSDYDEARARGWYGRPDRGAPVDEEGKPVYHYAPKSWDQAKTDGQRWRWCLVQAMEYAPDRTPQVLFHFAQFLHSQFGVQTMAYYGRLFGHAADADDQTRKDESGPWALSSLGEDETIARLANGIKRFKLPDEFNCIKVLQQIAEKYPEWGSGPLETLAQIFEDRQQYPKAADYWRKAIQKWGGGGYRQERLEQIIGNWGMFEPIVTAPAGQGATVDFRFRNSTKVAFVATEVKVPELLADVKEYLKSNPKQIDWERVNIANIGYSLMQGKQEKYLGKEVARWEMELKPRPKHFDKRVTVATPLQKPGAYLLSAQVSGSPGDTPVHASNIIVWVADTAVVKKQLDKQVLYYLADAVTGKPVAKANVEFFGYWQEWVENKLVRGQGSYTTHTVDFAEFTDADGQIILDQKRQPTNYSYLIIARTGEDEGGRLAFLGFTGVWYGQHYDAEYNETKYFTMTDRPVYRPEQKVQFKIWANQAQYDREGNSPFAGQKFFVEICNPKNEKVFRGEYAADDYGGFNGEYVLPKDATLGMYNINLPDRGRSVGNFRVEEYKKPEFEVKVDSPKEPVMLGEKITATIEAKYLFGAPVKEAQVKYKVLRTSHDSRWYPLAAWDWFYGRGYWWFACDYPWYPGWREWGCPRPIFWWWPRWGPAEQPEIVAEAEVPVGPEGKVSVDIDTSVAKAAHGDTDHKYEITAEVTDLSRRTIVGTGTVLVARKPFKVYAWVDRGHYRVGDVVGASFCAQTIDNKPVKGKGELRLLKVTYEKDKETGQLKPVEKEVQKWALDTNEEGRAGQQLKASEPGQYRLSYKVTDSKDHAIEGGYVFTVIGEGFDGSEFRFNDLELVTDKQQYAPGDKVQLMVNTDRKGATVLLFVRPTNGVALPPKTLRMEGKSAIEAIEVTKKDMPNFFVEAITVHHGKVYSEMREIIVPPESRVLNVKVEALGPAAPKPQTVKPAAAATTKPAEVASAAPGPTGTGEPLKVKPSDKVKVRVKLTDATGEPFEGSAVVAMYDKALEYISGGSNVPDIKEFFWKWRRHHQMGNENSLARGGGNMVRVKEVAMAFLGVFGHMATELPGDEGDGDAAFGMTGGETNGGKMLQTGGRPGVRMMKSGNSFAEALPAPSLAPAPMMMKAAANGEVREDKAEGGEAGGGGETALVQPTIRTNFADTALWAAALTAGKDGTCEVELAMPENLTTWKTKVWAMGSGARCGEGEAEVITTKNLIIRLQAPRFFVQKDEVVLSANVHNYLKDKKKVKVVLELEGVKWSPMWNTRSGVGANDLPGMTQDIEVDAGGEKRVDWRVKVTEPGQATVRMKAITDEESDAMEMKFPVFVHGMLKTESFSGAIRGSKDASTVTVKVPAERRPEQSRLEIRYSPTLAGAMVDALPYLADYPYGCTEQTLNRFLPAVITQKVLLRMNLDLKEIQKKRTNLNAQEIGDDAARAKDWAYRGGYMSRETARVKEAVFDEQELKAMVKAGLERLASMQCSDGGWGWFSGYGEQSWPHTTAVVVHGLQIARANDVAIVPGVLERGVAWLKNYQAAELQKLKNARKEPKVHPWKEHVDDLDALVFMVLVDEKFDNKEMRQFLYDDRNALSVYSKAMLGLAMHKLGLTEERDMLLRNVEQYLVQDEENQSAFLKLPNEGYWWCWYGSEYEAHAYYLKLLAAVDPKGEKASRVVKYLINNRKHASYWNSTRDTAVVIEAMADYIKASGEDAPDMLVEIFIDGKQVKEVKIDKDNIFSFDNKLILEGEKVAAGEHKIEIKRRGKGPVYFNAYLTNFTLEDPITKAGLEIKVQRKFFRLSEVDKKVKVEGAHGQALDQKVEKYERQPLEWAKNAKGEIVFPTLKSGQLVEIELEIDSKNDYEYIVFEDMKAAGFEPVEVRSGYNGNEMGAYVEFRDERVVFFVRHLARGKHSISYRMRAEIPGKFSALPAKASAMYAPELKANSDEMKVAIQD